MATIDYLNIDLNSVGGDGHNYPNTFTDPAMEMLDRIRGTLADWPNAGGDIEIARSVENIIEKDRKRRDLNLNELFIFVIKNREGGFHLALSQYETGRGIYIYSVRKKSRSAARQYAKQLFGELQWRAPRDNMYSWVREWSVVKTIAS